MHGFQILQQKIKQEEIPWYLLPSTLQDTYKELTFRLHGISVLQQPVCNSSSSSSLSSRRKPQLLWRSQYLLLLWNIHPMPWWAFPEALGWLGKPIIPGALKIGLVIYLLVFLQWFGFCTQSSQDQTTSQVHHLPGEGCVSWEELWAPGTRDCSHRHLKAQAPAWLNLLQGRFQFLLPNPEASFLFLPVPRLGIRMRQSWPQSAMWGRVDHPCTQQSGDPSQAGSLHCSMPCLITAVHHHSGLNTWTSPGWEKATLKKPDFQFNAESISSQSLGTWCSAFFISHRLMWSRCLPLMS